MKSLILSSILLLTACVNAQILDDVWELSELNDPNYTDAYPYLTDDGLRIYFTSNDGMGNNLFFSSRPDLDTDFASKQLLDSTLFSNLETIRWLVLFSETLRQASTLQTHHGVIASVHFRLSLLACMCCAR